MDAEYCKPIAAGFTRLAQSKAHPGLRCDPPVAHDAATRGPAEHYPWPVRAGIAIGGSALLWGLGLSLAWSHIRG